MTLQSGYYTNDPEVVAATHALSALIVDLGSGEAPGVKLGALSAALAHGICEHASAEQSAPELLEYTINHLRACVAAGTSEGRA